jgi:hypothetical protein
VKDVTVPNIVNVHVKNANTANHDLVFTYGRCAPVSFDEVHDMIAKVSGGSISGDDIPDDVSTGGCITAWEQEQKQIIGQSAPLSLDSIIHAALAKCDVIPMTNDSGIDAEGPWLNGVSLFKNKEIGAVDVKKAKSKCKCGLADSKS